MEEAAPGEIKMFHYTTRKGLDSILKDGFIRESRKKNNKKKKRAHFGEGTYGTSLPPKTDRKTIAYNNWRTHWLDCLNQGKVDRAIEVSIPEHEVTEVGQPDRDILLYPEGNLYLDEYSWKVWTVPENNTSSPKLLRKSAPKGRVSSFREARY